MHLAGTEGQKELATTVRALLPRRSDSAAVRAAIETPEEEFRVPFSAYARPFNFLGWPAIAIGETQLAARDMRTLLEAALAWPPA